MIKGIIFDMDGVIVNSEPLYNEYEYKFFKNLGANVTVEYFEKYVGCSLNHTINGVCKDFNINIMSIEDISNLFSRGTELIYSNPRLKLCEGVIDWLEFFKINGYPMILASSTFKYKIEICLDRFNLKHFFNNYIGGDEVNNSKPNPEIFIKACDKLNLKPSECIVIEDSTNGIKAAKSAGCFTIGYLNKGQNYQDITQADIVFDTFGKDKLPMLKKMLWYGDTPL
ncbi:MAG: HAD family phosphatase [Tissierellia bacterium]|nr:HAD family phosphatase [Tissierellia bacterium]